MRLPRCLIGCLGFLVASFSLSAQEPKVDSIRSIYQPKHLNAKLLAEALGQLFKGDAEITSLTDSGTSVVLFSASKSTTESIRAVLDQLDQKPKLIKIQVAMFESTTKPDEPKLRLSDTELKELEGTTEVVFEKLEAFQKEGKIHSLRRVELTAAENQKTQQMTGSDKATATGNDGGPAKGGFGNPRMSVSYRNVGWTVTVTPQLSEDRVITIDLSMSDSQLTTPEDGVNLNGTIIPEMRLTQLQSKIQLVSGQATLAQGVKTQSKNSILQTYVVVGTKLVPERKRGQ